MIVLGVDPGLGITGYGIIEAVDSKLRLIEAGVVRTHYKTPIEDRLKKIYLALSSLIKEYKPKTIVLENLYSHYKHPTTVICMGQARGVICLLAGLHNIPLVGYSSTRIKKAIAGEGRASKLQIQKMIQSTFSLKTMPQPPDVADALSLAVAYVNIERPKDKIV